MFLIICKKIFCEVIGLSDFRGDSLTGNGFERFCYNATRLRFDSNNFHPDFGLNWNVDRMTSSFYGVASQSAASTPPNTTNWNTSIVTLFNSCFQNFEFTSGINYTVFDVSSATTLANMFYQASGGGVTASGGEPLLHPDFIYALFKECREVGIHTCLETAGYSPLSHLQKIIPITDYVLYDLKHMDSNTHLRLTGKPNDIILSNAKFIVESGVTVLFRMPLVPTVNDSLQNIQNTAYFLQSLGSNVCRIELMPYHRLGKSK